MSNRIYIVTALCCMALSLHAETREERMLMRNELRIGWGDQAFESLIWHNPTHYDMTTIPGYTRQYAEDYHYDQHLWAEYQYRHNEWFSYGVQADISHVRWTHVTRDGQGKVLMRDPVPHTFYNAVLIPTLRFTYLHHEHFNLYCSLGLGMDINGGTETNAQGKNTEAGMAIDIVLLGISANYRRWFWTCDLGGLYAARDMNTIYLCSSKILRLGLGVRF